MSEIPSMRALAVLLLASTTACPASCPRSNAIPSRNDIVLPKSARRLLDREFPKWRFTPVKTVGDCTAQVGDRPAEVTADFNNDGLMDWGLLIQDSAGTHLIALMRLLDDFQIYRLEVSADRTSTRYLAVERRGNSFTSPQTGSRDFFGNDTLVTRSCGPDRIAYFWQGTRFDRVVLP